MYSVVMILPPKPLLRELKEWMFELNLKYNTSKALLYEPHITLKSLGDIDEQRIEKVISALKAITEEIHPFLIRMKNLRFFGSTKDIKGIYVTVERTSELFNFHKRLVMLLKKYDDGKDRSYKELDNWNPHITLVADDISIGYLKRAKRELDISYENYFACDRISLFLDERGSKKYLHFKL